MSQINKNIISLGSDPTFLRLCQQLNTNSNSNAIYKTTTTPPQHLQGLQSLETRIRSSLSHTMEIPHPSHPSYIPFVLSQLSYLKYLTTGENEG
ncbi:MAG: hypothetical protein Sylvanvirus6_5 [Sylvanvirus sp.]|uniref:Uncharacterized protein n=1 Tax=Sylvanvirus sp. TaxID=2487774 RepID=A0A3G5AJ91_9VIRU|nr:MAG: hypothetical protein Sylvanvirus6_5 [Sylvanvirus sp.]